MNFENSHRGTWEVSTTRSDRTFIEGLFQQKNSDKVNPSDSYPQTPRFATSPATSTPSSLASTSVTAFVSHASPTHGTLFVSLSISPHFGNIKGKKRKSSIGGGHANNWLSVCSRWTDVLKQDNTIFCHISVILNRRTWLLHGGHEIYSWNSFLFSFDMIDSSASNDASMIFQVLIEERNAKFPQSQFSFFDLLTSHQLLLYRDSLSFSISNDTAGTSKHFQPDE